MPVNIDFRGVMLFECTKADEGTLTQVLLPNGEEDSPWPENKRHPGGEEARTHHAGLVKQPKGSLQIDHVPLKYTVVEINFDGETSDPYVAISELPKLKPATFNSGVVDPELASVRITAKGGKLIGYPPIPSKFKSKPFVNHTVSHYGARLTHDRKAAIIVRDRDGDVLDSLDINHGDKVAFYNYEARYPLIADLDPSTGNCETNMPHDPDFIWLYSLLRGWNKHNYHLSPRVDCAASGDVNPEHITIFTCFPGVWENDV